MPQELIASGEREIALVTSGDLRLAANRNCWPAQKELEQKLASAFAARGYTLVRAHAYDAAAGHGFISSQREGMDVFTRIHPRARLVFATAAWQYSHHVLPGLRTHEGPILTVANWSGQWPGLVGLLNLNGSLVKAGVPFSSIWSRDFTDTYFDQAIEEWLRDGRVTHDASHVHALDVSRIAPDACRAGNALAAELKHRKAILGVFDEGCMGMYNAIVDDELLNPAGMYKERLSQAALVARMRAVSGEEARAVYDWLVERGVRFQFGERPETDLTLDQVLDQCRMYIAAVRIAHEFGCEAIGIQYQQGLKDMAPASDLVEGLLNNAERPPVLADGGSEELYGGAPLVHFNEVDECAGADALITSYVWRSLGHDPSTTLHDIRWGEHYQGNGLNEFVWLLQISGAAPPNHFIGGYGGAVSERQPPMYFPLGGGCLKGIGRPGEIVWSRVFVEAGALHVDLGRGSVVSLPAEETERRWQQTTYQWPIVHAVFHGVSQNQFMGRHRANHVNIVYAPSAEAAEKALAVKAAMMYELGITVHICGRTDLTQGGR